MNSTREERICKDEEHSPDYFKENLKLKSQTRISKNNDKILFGEENIKLKYEMANSFINKFAQDNNYM
jgi:hypothetical protein